MLFFIWYIKLYFYENLIIKFINYGVFLKKFYKFMYNSLKVDFFFISVNMYFIIPEKISINVHSLLKDLHGFVVSMYKHKQSDFNFDFNENIFLSPNILFFIGICLFILGLYGTFFRIDKIIVFLMCIELMWLGISLCFLSYYINFPTTISLIFPLVILAIAAGETAIGLSLLVNFYRINKSISLRYLSNLRG